MYVLINKQRRKLSYIKFHKKWGGSNLYFKKIQLFKQTFVYNKEVVLQRRHIQITEFELSELIN